jgi:DNA repair photolyase
VDWAKQIRINAKYITKLGVEIQVSARSDLLIRDIVHLRNSLQEGSIDVGVIIVPDDRMQRFLPDRTPAFRDAVRYIEKEFKEATTFPIVIIAVEHDSPGRALAKKKRKAEIGEPEID